MHIALYCRVSTDEQAKHGESIGDQQQALIRWASEHGYTYDVYADEGYSAHKAYKSRPALMQLLGRIDEYGLVCFTKLDRWTRKTADYYKIEEQLHGTPWRAILEDYETQTADGRFKVGIMLSVNQHEAERTSDRIKFTFAEKRKRGEICSGHMPRGYKLVDGKPVKSEDAEAISAFWKVYFVHGMGAAQIAAAEHGLRIPSSNASFMLRNAAHYAGQIQGVPCEPYITPEQAEMILGSRRSRPKQATHVFLFSGLAFCGECGNRFGGHINRYAHTDGSSGTQIFYNCNHRHREKPHGCGNRTCIMESDVEKYCIENIASALDLYRAELIEAAKKSAKLAADAEKRKKQLAAKKQRAYEAYIDGIVDKIEFEQQRAKIEAELAGLETSPEVKELPAPLPEGWREIYTTLDDAHKREFWLKIVREIRIYADRHIEIVPR